MATESPLLHDGSQTTAAANYYNPSVALDGPNGSGQFLAVYLSAARVVTVDTSAGTNVIYGLLQNTPAAGQAADVGIFGISKAVAAASFSAGVDLMTDANGRVQLATSTNRRFAVSIEAATVAGQIVTVFITGSNRTT